ncbi:hypothetical protein BB561_002186 [Smittium simulii]|uniref:Endoplasmic reticulum transmembrane protein n=1 Tax=Smittium simulii TaxID=133385 RepID=A0A2T9YRE7_9FUNG|nr:hypothetical protein BB561_002186 [Smittium simulii]
MFYAQRNIYLTGFTLLLGLIMLATHTLIAELIETRTQVLDARKLNNIHAASDESIVANKQSEISALKEKLAKINKELEEYNVSDYNFAQVKSKAKNSREEYLELLEAHEKLLKKVEKIGSKSKLV